MEILRAVTMKIENTSGQLFLLNEIATGKSLATRRNKSWMTKMLVSGVMSPAKYRSTSARGNIKRQKSYRIKFLKVACLCWAVTTHQRW